MSKLKTFGLACRSGRRKADNAADFGGLKVACIVTAFWIATAIASPAQSFTTVHSFAGYPTEGPGLTQG